MALTPGDAALSHLPPGAAVVASELSSDRRWGVFLVLRDPSDSQPWTVCVRNVGTHWEYAGESAGGSPMWHSTSDLDDPSAPNLGVRTQVLAVRAGDGRPRWALRCTWGMPLPER